MKNTILSVRFDAHDSSVKLHIHNSNSSLLTIVRENFMEVGMIRLDANETTTIVASNSETLTVIARQNGCLVAAGILEIDTTLRTIDAILAPKSLCNLILNQQSLATQSLDRAVTHRAVKSSQFVELGVK